MTLQHPDHSAVDPRRPHIERTPFEPIEAPSTITLYFCPACGRQIIGTYNIDPARKRCTKTWHLMTAKPASYRREEATNA